MKATQRVWKPHPKQEEFLTLPDTIFEGLYGGAAGGGKSECLLLYPICREFYKHPKFKGIIFRRTYPELEKEVIVRSFDFYLPLGGAYNEEKKRWKFPGGGQMNFGHVEFDKDVRKYDSTEYNYMSFDELTSFTEEQYLYLVFSRCRSGSRELPAITRSATNPGNIGHGWVRKRFIEAGPYGTILLDPTTKQKRIFIQSKATDNPHIDPGYIDRMAGLPEAERRAKRDGDWYTFSGQVFDEWREKPLSDEDQHGYHVVPFFVIPDWYPRVLAVDWGYRAMMCALWGAMAPDGRVYIYREYTAKQTKIAVWATEIGRLSHGETFVDVVLCQSAWQNRGDAQTIAEQFEEFSGLSPRLADNNRVAGKTVVEEFLRIKPKPDRKVLPYGEYSQDTAMDILRKHGLPAYRSYLSSFQPTPIESNLPKLQVFEQCVSLRRVIPLCVYDDVKKEDVAEFAGDDPYDTLRYLLMAIEHYKVDTSVVKHHEDVGKILAEFDKNQDYNYLHRSMKKVEQQKPDDRPIRLASLKGRRHARIFH